MLPGFNKLGVNFCFFAKIPILDVCHGLQYASESIQGICETQSANKKLRKNNKKSSFYLSKFL